ncbi:hypothetical protein [Nostoc sp.]
MSPRKIAVLYRELKQEQLRQPIERQWHYGARLKIIKAAYQVASEPQPTN